MCFRVECELVQGNVSCLMVMSKKLVCVFVFEVKVWRAVRKVIRAVWPDYENIVYVTFSCVARNLCRERYLLLLVRRRLPYIAVPLICWKVSVSKSK